MGWIRICLLNSMKISIICHFSMEVFDKSICKEEIHHANGPLIHFTDHFLSCFASDGLNGFS